MSPDFHLTVTWLMLMLKICLCSPSCVCMGGSHGDWSSFWPRRAVILISSSHICPLLLPTLLHYYLTHNPLQHRRELHYCSTTCFVGWFVLYFSSLSSDVFLVPSHVDPLLASSKVEVSLPLVQGRGAQVVPHLHHSLFGMKTLCFEEYPMASPFADTRIFLRKTQSWDGHGTDFPHRESLSICPSAMDLSGLPLVQGSSAQREIEGSYQGNHSLSRQACQVNMSIEIQNNGCLAAVDSVTRSVQVTAVDSVTKLYRWQLLIQSQICKDGSCWVQSVISVQCTVTLPLDDQPLSELCAIGVILEIHTHLQTLLSLLPGLSSSTRSLFCDLRWQVEVLFFAYSCFLSVSSFEHQEPFMFCTETTGLFYWSPSLTQGDKGLINC